MTDALIAYVAPATQAAALRTALQQAGCKQLLALDAGDWVRQLGALVGVHAPQQVVCALAAGPWLAAVLPWAGRAPLPATVLAGPAEAPPDASTLAALLTAGMTGWWAVLDATQPPALLATALQLDALRWQAGQALQATLANSRSALDERLWVDRAKGLLMQAGRAAPALREDQAFAMLRSAAMHAKLRLAELSRAVVEATVWAEAINRAGQLRMLSQRLVKLAAQRLAGVDAPGALAHQHTAAARVVDNLLFLDRLKSPLGQPQTQPEAPRWAAELQQVHAAWAALQAVLAQRPGRARLAQADALAGQLLAVAEALAATLQTCGGRPALQIVNQCGRQRMQVQRLAKEALLAALLAEPARQAALPALVLAVDEGLTALAGSPLSSPEIRTLLDDARQQWQRLCAVLRHGAGGDGLAVLVHTSDALADRLDQLTDAYEHSLQVIMS